MPKERCQEILGPAELPLINDRGLTNRLLFASSFFFSFFGAARFSLQLTRHERTEHAARREASLKRMSVARRVSSSQLVSNYRVFWDRLVLIWALWNYKKLCCR